MSLPQKSKSVKSHVQFRIENRDSDSDSDSDSIDLGDSTKAKEGEPDYYDPVYFDSDSDSDDNKEEEEEGPSVTSNKDVQVKKEDQDDDEMEYDIRAGISSSTTTTSSSSSMKDITMGLEKNSLESSKKTSKKNKKHPTLSDVDLLYDPDQDEKDQEWLMKKIAANRPPGCKPEDIWTDAILSCPMCLTQLCFDCQQHEFYPHQFRAMFVENCRILENEILRFPKETQKPNRNNNDKSTKTTTTTTTQQSSDFAHGFKPSMDDDDDMTYHPVSCEICNTKVALIDQDEVFHFFNVIPDEV